MRSYLKSIVCIALLTPILLFSQSIDHLEGKWEDKEKENNYILEIDGQAIRWKNINSQNWNNLKFVKGSEYVDDDGYIYQFDPKKGTVKVINPDNVRDFRFAYMIDFVLPGKSAPVSTTRTERSASDYKGAHGFLLTYRGSVNAPIGIGIGGIGKKFGIYGAFRFSSRPETYTNTVYRSNNNHQVVNGNEPPTTTGPNSKESKSYVYTGYNTDTRGAFTLGAIIPIQPFISAFAGIGLGWSNYWEVYDVYNDATLQLSDDDSQVWAINEDKSIAAGLEFEFGAMAHWKVFNATLGLSMVNFSSPDVVLGLGFQF